MKKLPLSAGVFYCEMLPLKIYYMPLIFPDASSDRKLPYAALTPERMSYFGFQPKERSREVSHSLRGVPSGFERS